MCQGQNDFAFTPRALSLSTKINNGYGEGKK